MYRTLTQDGYPCTIPEGVSRAKAHAEMRATAAISANDATVGRINLDDPDDLNDPRLTLARQVAAACLVAVRRHRRERRSR